MGIETAIVGSAIVGGAMSAKGAKDAAKTQAGAAKDAGQLQYQMYEQTREDQAPYRAAGYSGLNKLGYLLGLDSDGFSTGGSSGAPIKPDRNNELYMIGSGTPPPRPAYLGRPTHQQLKKQQDKELEWLLNKKKTTFDSAQYNKDMAEWELATAAYKKNQASLAKNPEYGSLLRKFGMNDFQTDPGYQFRMDEGIKGLDRSAAARGGLLSGAALKGINRFSQNFASNEYGNAYNRFNQDQSNKFNRLASIAGIGQTATNQVQQAGQNYATNAGNAMMGAGNAIAAGQVGASNAISGALNNVSQYNMMNSMLSQPSGLNTPTSFAKWGGGTNDYQGYY